MIYGSVCSGIEAASVAWHPLGWKASFLSEIEKFPCEMLSHHYPEVPLHGDFTTIKKGMYEDIDLLVGGTPCQSFSVAGLRGGLNDPRGNLMLGFVQLADALRPRWIVWENVPGVLSSNGGKDFGTLLGALGEIGYGFAYRVLDAQYFGVAQRRRRVFVIGCLGDWRSAASVLFESESLRGDPPPSRSPGQEITGTLTRGFGDRGYDLDQIAGGGGYAIQTATYDYQSNCSYGRGEVNHTLAARDYKGPTDLVVQRHILDNPAYALDSLSSNSMKSANLHSGCNAVDEAIPINTMTMMGRPSDDLKPRMGLGIGKVGDPQNTLTKAHSHAVAYSVQGEGYGVAKNMQVRHLTPVECEKLQGFPDNYTKINDKTADSPRYKALGNSMAVPVMRWIGERIEYVEALKSIL